MKEIKTADCRFKHFLTMMSCACQYSKGWDGYFTADQVHGKDYDRWLQIKIVFYHCECCFSLFRLGSMDVSL